MKKCVAVLLIASLCSLGAYFLATASPKPPVPDVSAAGKKVPVIQGSYCWKAFFSTKCVDWAYAPPLKIGNRQEPVEVAPSSPIKIHFEKEPVSLSVKRKINEEKEINVKMMNQKINAPSESGTYVYHLIVNWRQGDGSYVFRIKVK
ncbi:hypothetical protein SAMN05192569_100277 [Parageobacillus thermantarcticus]|uniref:Uncharacterized protein n=1 Tax=Parageobacillus thermantarcticus TaxID=186116 RepID=A0A1I0SLN2_9BACL|nr:hypothetical protein SAMN05192569_100277 [Parageobacillus thermantarcticus]